MESSSIVEWLEFMGRFSRCFSWLSCLFSLKQNLIDRYIYIVGLDLSSGLYSMNLVMLSLFYCIFQWLDDLHAILSLWTCFSCGLAGAGLGVNT